MGIGNLLVGLWEDARCFPCLSRLFRTKNVVFSMSDPDTRTCLSAIMYTGYVLHHTTAMFAFGFSLSTGKLTGLCSIGLFFEAPFVPFTWRELIVSRDGSLRLLRKWSRVRLIHVATIILFILTRLSATGLYFYAICDRVWRLQVETLDAHSLRTFHVLGIFFTL